jgi:glycosyltransferase involved in cell wall biosynthesis
MNNDLVSVVIPAYKCADVISSAIESVFSQTYRNYELIVIDDGSPDNTAEVINKYRERVRYIYQKNGGVSKARNTGIINSTGTYIALLDADDVWNKTKLEIQMRLFEKHPEIGLLCSAFWNTKHRKIIKNKDYKDTFNFFREYGYEINDIFEYKSCINYGDNNIEYHWGNIYDYLFLGNFILPSSVIAKKETIVSSGIFNEELRVAEETDFFLNYSKNNVIGFIDSPLVYYELPNTDNLSGKSNLERLIKNALRIQIDSFISDQYYQRKNEAHYLKGISKTYYRLAYYYISEYNTRDSRKYAVYAMKTDHYNIGSYLIWFISHSPNNVLNLIMTFKRWVTKAKRSNGYSLS